MNQMKTKIRFVGLLVLFFGIVSYGQQKIEASKILQDIKSGKSIAYENATIVGTFDLTFREDAIKKNPKKKKSWFNWNQNGTSNVIEKNIKTKLSFVNCTFEDDVLAYIPDENSGYTYIANFEEDVIFKNCTFEQKALFKYSKFSQHSEFSESKFNGDSSFKYGKFERKALFDSSIFYEIATFKYAYFNNHANFSEAVFKDTAIFKYAKFSEGVSFKNSKFEDNLDLKFAMIDGDFNINGMRVAFNIENKYTQINGQSFSKFLVHKN